MKPLTVLNTREIKELNKELEERFGFSVPKSFVFVVAGDNKINLTTRAIEQLNIAALRMARLGMYFCTKDKYGVRLSIEGSQLFKDTISKNIINITPEQERLWLFGKDLELSPEQIKDTTEGISVVRCGEDLCGCGRIRQGNILQNFVPKERRTGTIE